MKNIATVLKLGLPLVVGGLFLKALYDGWRVRSLSVGGYVVRKESASGDRAHLGNPWEKIG